ncbi:MAG: choice-of-anchor D domain-containing protein [Gammaproteobacteria bacterium]|nr:choice-of-anchor D domain-containing protein [Gammaproteobacteria bacterium]
MLPMIQKHLHGSASILIFLLLTSPIVQATIVQMEFTIGAAPAQSVYVEMFDTETSTRTAASVTVANFLNYIDDGRGTRRYDGSIVNRSIPGFIIQGGKIQFDSSLGDDFGTTSATSAIKKSLAIINEFDSSRSNVRGTIAMAKTPGNPNSATSEWFFNLVDNSSFPQPDGSDVGLDFQNSGFTVFGQVLANGMAVIDAIAALPALPLPGLPNLPLSDYVVGDAVKASNLVMLTAVTVNPSVPVVRLPAQIDFQFVAINSGGDQQTVTVENIGAATLNVGQLESSLPLAAPFSISNDLCSNQPVSPAGSCTFSILFNPTQLGNFTGSIDVPSNDAIGSNLVVNVRGSGAPATASLDVTPVSSVEFGIIPTGDSSTQVVTVKNVGGGALSLGASTITGTDTVDFLITGDNCSAAVLSINQACTIAVQLTATNEGAKAAILNVSASPDAQAIALPLSGTVALSQASLVIPEIDVDFGEITFGAPAPTLEVPFGNSGTDDLIFSPITITGADAGEFSITNNCQRLTSAERICNEVVTFSPTSTGVKSASLLIQTNDPDKPSATLAVLGISRLDSDNDGVQDDIESAGPNGGDGNQDGTPDSQQQNVSSLQTINGDYVTLEAEIGTRLTRVSTGVSPDPSGGTPIAGEGATLNFPNGFFFFEIEGVPVGGSTTVTLYLPPGQEITNYFKYGVEPIPQNNLDVIPHWYLFEYNGSTGAELLGDRIVLHYVDGETGDNDLTQDGRIMDPGGPAILALNSSSSGGGGGGCSLSAPKQNRGLPIDFIVLLFGLFVIRARRFYERADLYARKQPPYTRYRL